MLKGLSLKKIDVRGMKAGLSWTVPKVEYRSCFMMKYIRVALCSCTLCSLCLSQSKSCDKWYSASDSGVSFFGTLSKIFYFFGRSLKRWAELAPTEQSCKKLNLKVLCTTRWSSRVAAVRSVKHTYTDILKVMPRLCLESRDAKETTEAISLKKKSNGKQWICHLHRDMGTPSNFH